MKPTLSVMTPVRNGEPFLRRCYESLRAQTVTDWEWLLVDDASTDGSFELMQELAGTDDRIRIHRHASHRGTGHARELILEQARAEWIAVWDVDDLYFPWRLEESLEILRQGCDFVCSYAVVVDPEMRELGVRGFPAPFRTERVREFTHSTLACVTKLGREIGYSPELKTVNQIGEDKRIILTLAARYRGVYIPAPLVIHQPSIGSLRRAIHSNWIALRLSFDLYRSGTLPVPPSLFFGRQARTLAKIAMLNLLWVRPSLYARVLRRRLLGPPAPGYTLTAREREFMDLCIDRYAPDAIGPSLRTAPEAPRWLA